MPRSARALPKRTVVGAEALAALAIPARFRILSHLLAVGPQTASQCAQVVGLTPSNCSWHLRALAKIGLVEPAPQKSADARTRPWRATVVGLDFSEADSAASGVAQSALDGLSAGYSDELHRRYLSARSQYAPEIAAASTSNDYSLNLTPAELETLIGRLDDLIRPYVRTIRPPAPTGSTLFHLTLRAFPNPDAPETGTREGRS